MTKLERNNRIHSYIVRGHKVFKEDKLDAWDKVVPVRVDDLYNGLEVENALQIVEEYERSHDVTECRRIFNEANHSGWSAGLVKAIIYQFYEKWLDIFEGLEFDIPVDSKEDN